MEDEHITSSVPFTWCGDENRHGDCKKSYRRFSINDKTKKPVYEGITVHCGCKKRGCACYVKPADRVKKTTTRRRKK